MELRDLGQRHRCLQFLLKVGAHDTLLLALLLVLLLQGSYGSYERAHVGLQAAQG